MKLLSLKTLISLLLLVVTLPLAAQELYSFRATNGKDGFTDESGKIVIPAQFDEVRNFSEGLAPVKQNGKWGYIDKTGEIVIPAQFDYIGNFSEGLASVKQNGKWGFIDKTGKMVIPAQFDDALGFSEGLASVEQIGEYGYIDKTGKMVIPAQFDYALYFSEGLAMVDQNGYEFYIDKQGRRYSPEAEEKEFLAQEARQASSQQTVAAQEVKPAQTVQKLVLAQPVVAQNTVTSSGAKPQPRTVDYADKMVDVDAGIPTVGEENYSTYAVVIANEKYTKVAEVGNAANDGAVLRQYLTKTLGIPENNVIYCADATSADMDDAISMLETKAKSAAAVGKRFNIIFYYSGHGVPAEGTTDAYLLPVDVSPKNITKYGLPLDDLYRRLGALRAQCVTVFLDACFSGAGRDNRMLAEVKGVQLEPKKSTPTGNMVVLSACSGRETANIYKEGKHGLFTYWLLRKLKETNGNVSLGELQEHLSKYVDYTATNRLNLPGQKPTVQASPTMNIDWRTVRLR